MFDRSPVSFSNHHSPRVLAFQAKPPTAPEGHSNNLKILYSATKNPTGSVKKKAARHIPQVAHMS